MSSGQKPRTLVVARAILDGLDRGIATMLTRFTERLTVYARWSRPVRKAQGEISGDALAPYIRSVAGMPLPNIWNTKGEHGNH